MLRPEDLRAFASRDWKLLDRMKRDHWARRLARLGPAESLRVATSLRLHVQAMRGLPTAAEREADLQGHIRLAELLRCFSENRRR